MKLPRPLLSLGYVMSRGVKGMIQAPVVQLLGIGTMAVCMLLLGATVLSWHNARRVVENWGIDIPVTAYMAPDAPAGSGDDLAARLQSLPEVASVRVVAPDDALAELAEGLGEETQLLEGVDPALMPSTVEIRLAPDVAPRFGDALAERLRTMDEVEEVAVVGPWAQRARDLLDTLQWLAVGAGALVSLACLTIVWSTIRLGVYARRAEIQILNLVGGTASFVRGPFIFEGFVQGAVAAAAALGALRVGFDLVRPFVERGLSLLFAAGALEFFTWPQWLAGLGFGAVVGVVGSRAAVGRYMHS